MSNNCSRMQLIRKPLSNITVDREFIKWSEQSAACLRPRLRHLRVIQGIIEILHPDVPFNITPLSFKYLKRVVNCMIYVPNAVLWYFNYEWKFSEFLPPTAVDARFLWLPPRPTYSSAIISEQPTEELLNIVIQLIDVRHAWSGEIIFSSLFIIIYSSASWTRGISLDSQKTLLILITQPRPLHIPHNKKNPKLQNIRGYTTWFIHLIKFWQAARD